MYIRLFLSSTISHLCELNCITLSIVFWIINPMCNVTTFTLTWPDQQLSNHIHLYKWSVLHLLIELRSFIMYIYIFFVCIYIYIYRFYFCTKIDQWKNNVTSFLSVFCILWTLQSQCFFILSSKKIHLNKFVGWKLVIKWHLEEK